MSTESHRLNEGIKKLIYSLVPGLAAFFGLFQLPINTRLIIAWDVFSVVLLLFYWTVFFKTDDKKLPRIVATEDDGVKIIFSIVLVAVCVSFLGVILLYQIQEEASRYKWLQAFISLSAIVCSWILLHTIFTTRYADLYFKDRKRRNQGGDAEALMFPSSEKPDYLDFAYFSFVIGMTFQVSDIQINSKMMRRFVLLHSLISFAFNTVIVAITINVIVNLGK
ncbi:DUF1345 domain-containing protein [Niabella sp. CJ426]|uniref:DUF1345 domain-containing protein n=1 Tax=Niabella sp. CJ426 TaxID=3393740 RepID=UPI003CFE8293